MVAQGTNRTERAAKGTLVSFFQYGTQMLLQAFLTPFVLRIAGQESLGAYALLMQVIGFLALLTLGFSVTLNLYLAKANGYDDEGKRFCEVLTTAQTFLLGSNIIFAILTLLLSLKIDVLFSMTPQIAAQARLGLCLLAIWGVVRTPWVVYGIGLNATQNLVAANFIGIIGNVARVLFSLGLLLAGLELVGLILANILAEVLFTVLSTRHFRRLYPLRRPAWGIPDKTLSREMMVFSAQVLLINVAWRLVYYTDNIVIGYLYGAAVVSVYYTTQMPTTIGFNIVNRLADNASPAVNELYARRDDAKVREVFLRLHRFTILLVLPIVGGILLLNRRLITLWVGSGQYAGDLMTYALAAFAFLITVSHVNGTFIYASGKIRRLSLVAVLEGVSNLGLSIWLGKTIGLPGVMLGSVIANIPATAYLLIVTMRSMGIGITEFFRTCVLPSLFPIAIAYTVGHLTGRLIPGGGWVSFIAQGTILLIVYGSIAYRLNLTQADRDWVGTNLLQPIYLISRRNHG